jgi:hypothetical protein
MSVAPDPRPRAIDPLQVATSRCTPSSRMLPSVMGGPYGCLAFTRSPRWRSFNRPLTMPKWSIA